ncbi:Polyadenylate-binding protein RBP45 [Zea mays]|uniref:Polyadenylate-binding protein RBP45 n=1 Tax=Zea mays TaxID=4577 RepID=A0A3L6FTA4_MAIZE|nr:Polyadenylate-binding protein RBP45 [Zea mays]
MRRGTTMVGNDGPTNLEKEQIASVKIIRNKQTGYSEGYGFIEFSSRAAAEHTLVNFNGQMMPNVEMTFKLN